MANTPSSYSFLPESVKQFGNDPGKGNLMVAEISGFTTFAPLPVTETNEGDLRIITGSHTFPATKGFRTITLYRGSSESEGSFPGDSGFKTKEYMVKGFLVGDKAANREFVEYLKNKGVILLQNPPDPADTRILQYGTQDTPAVVKDVKFTTGNRLTGGKSGYEITFEAHDLFDYAGTVTLQPDSKANPECQPKRKVIWSGLLSALDCLYSQKRES